ncbi:MAG: TRAP transporter TatT component family protein [Planctomycetes bacterium]|nr:TRAP transporter TatT component family protein [Planctomycetota bacterium]
MKTASNLNCNLLRLSPFPLILVGLLTQGCSVQRFAVNRLGDALAGGGDTFSSDDDPELIKAAAPFSLKLMETLLAESPRHEKLLLATASGFVQYGYAFVQQEADKAADVDFAESERLNRRVRNLYLRARNYALRGLEVRHPGIVDKLRRDPEEALRAARKRDVPLLYWTAAAWGAAISVSKDDPDLIADQPIVEALIDRALELDAEFGSGAIHAFLISYEMARQGAEGRPENRSREHFLQAVAMSQGQLAGPYVTFAESVCVQQQNVDEFTRLLEKARAVDVDARPEWRLENLVMQERAGWLLAKTDELFLLTE